MCWTGSAERSRASRVKLPVDDLVNSLWTYFESTLCFLRLGAADFYDGAWRELPTVEAASRGVVVRIACESLGAALIWE